MRRSHPAQFSGGSFTVSIEVTGPKTEIENDPRFETKLDSVYTTMLNESAAFITTLNKSFRPSGNQRDTIAAPLVTNHTASIAGHELSLKIELKLNEDQCDGALMGFGMLAFSGTFTKLVEAVVHEPHSGLLGGLLGDLLGESPFGILLDLGGDPLANPSFMGASRGGRRGFGDRRPSGSPVEF